MSLKITKGDATPSSVSLFFSDALVADTSANGAKNTANYTIKVPASNQVLTPVDIDYNSLFRAVTISLTPAQKIGEWIFVTVSNLAIPSNPAAISNPLSIAVQVNGEHEITESRAIQEAVAYPVLTEQVSFSPGGGMPASVGGGFPSSQSAASLGLVASNAISDVLGWKVNSTDSRGFVGALTQSFALTEKEGHTEATYTPRSYTVQTDLSQGITGAQASLYTRAKEALDKCLPLLEGLYPLNPEAELEDANALRGLARSQMMEIVKELGQVGGPSTLRVDTYFNILLGVPLNPQMSMVPGDADALTDGTLKELRDVFGIGFDGNPFSNTVADEEDITNFRIIVDYMTSLLQTWINNRRFFDLSGTSEAFLGTQLVLLSRQLSVIVETVNEVRFAMNSVFIGPSERQTLLLKFQDNSPTPMFVEDILGEIDRFASDEGPRLMQDGGRLAIQNNVLPVVKSLAKLAKQAQKPVNVKDLPDGYRTARVQNTWDDLHDQLKELIRLSKPIGRKLPPAEGGLFGIPGILHFDSPSATGQTATIVNLGATSRDLSIKVTGPPDASNAFAVDPAVTTIQAQQTGVVTITPNGPNGPKFQKYTLEILSAGLLLQTIPITVTPAKTQSKSGN